MSWLDALLGRIRSAGVDLALGNGLNFTSPLGATRNSSTGFIDVTSDVNRSADFDANPWTGPHKFEGQLLLGTEHLDTGSGDRNVVLGDVVRLRFSNSGTVNLLTATGAAEGRLLIVEFIGVGTHTVVHDGTGLNGFSCPGDTDLVAVGRSGFIAVGRVSTNPNWKIVATT